jgi:glycosyltransferase involved in cell wall biosynthesis
MINGIKKYEKKQSQKFDFSVLIPTWNNLEILKNCLKSIEENSSLSIQPIIIANEGKDGTLEWLEQNKYDYIHAKENIGICYALNICRSLIKSDYVVYLNDDMYVLPDWDTGFQREINAYNGKDFMFSGTMIEPTDTGNNCVIVKNYGNGMDNFEEEKLLAEYKSLEKNDWSGSTWPPNVVHIDLWDMVGGLSTEFSPGMYSDPDFSKKIYEAGIRDF